jgi:hypothetical protein
MVASWCGRILAECDTSVATSHKENSVSQRASIEEGRAIRPRIIFDELETVARGYHQRGDPLLAECPGVARRYVANVREREAARQKINMEDAANVTIAGPPF